MSTPATIKVDDVTFFWGGDGYPYDVWLSFSEDIKKAQERAKRNPDYPFFANLKYILMEVGTEFSDYDGFPSEYQFEVTEDGNIKVLNPNGIWVEIKYVLKDDRPEKIIITCQEGMEREFDSWDDYEEIFICDCEFEETTKMVDMQYRMVDTDGTNLEEHLVCPKCGKDEGIV